jgi:hypothetical protein
MPLFATELGFVKGLHREGVSYKQFRRARLLLQQRLSLGELFSRLALVLIPWPQSDLGDRIRFSETKPHKRQYGNGGSEPRNAHPGLFT